MVVSTRPATAVGATEPKPNHAQSTPQGAWCPGASNMSSMFTRDSRVSRADEGKDGEGPLFRDRDQLTLSPLFRRMGMGFGTRYEDEAHRFQRTHERVAAEIMAMRAARAFFEEFPGCSRNPQADVVVLPRGGLYVRSSVGPIQIGSPPETIKDSMSLGLEVPVWYVVPPERFSFRDCISVSEVEFPAYYNFFVLGKKINIVCTPEGERVIRAVFEETVNVSGDLRVDNEYGRFASIEDLAAKPNLQKECHFFSRPSDGKPNTTDRMMNFYPFDSMGVAKLTGKLEICIEDEREFVIYDGEKELIRCPTALMLPAPPAPRASLDSRFEPPDFGITVLGSSHGFDPKGTTTGFIVWMYGRGVCVDPPPHSMGPLRAHGIQPRHVTAVILTHCHADHDAGTFQKLLMENRIRVFTTSTIMRSFLRKYSQISGLEERFVRKLFDFEPVRLGQPNFWGGGHFNFFYSLHAIPCMGFEAHCGGRSLVYSADTLNDPARIRKMRDAGVLSPQRADALLNFPWHHDLIIHEAGVPPIHTPMATLQNLPDDVKERLLLIHVSDGDAAKSGLRHAQVGVNNTIRIAIDERERPGQNPATAARSGAKTARHENGLMLRSADVIEAVSTCDLLRGVRMDHSRDILMMTQILTFKRGETVVAKGERSEGVLIVQSGVVCSDGDDKAGPAANALARIAQKSTSSLSPKVTGRRGRTEADAESRLLNLYSSGEVIGDAPLFADTVQSRSLVALNEVTVIEISRAAVHRLVEIEPRIGT